MVSQSNVKDQAAGRPPTIAQGVTRLACILWFSRSRSRLHHRIVVQEWRLRNSGPRKILGCEAEIDRISHIAMRFHNDVDDYNDGSDEFTKRRIENRRK